VFHANARECIDALQHEVNRLKETLAARRHGKIAVSTSVAIVTTPGLLSPRIASIR